jgi:putative ABC transport system permease protein
MILSESFLTALDSLLANKLRSVLTMLGVIIGVAAVIALMAIGNGVSDSITSEIQSIGTNLIVIMTDGDNSDGYPALSLDDVEALSDPLLAPAVAQVSASVGGTREVATSGRTMRTSVNGVTANYFAVNNLMAFDSGGPLTQNDIDTSARVAVIGYAAAEELFEDTFPVGNSLRINGVAYEVVGVLEEQGQGFGNDTDLAAFVPITTAKERLITNRTRTGEPAVGSIVAQAVDEESTDAAIDQITEVLRREHGINYIQEDDFQIFSQTDLLATFDVIVGTLTAFLGAIAGISLVVGGIGIMNIMLVSVTERTREIGIRKAVGAKKRDILVQFLLEALVLSLLGGAIGIFIGWSIASIAGPLLDLTATVDVQTITLATSFAAAVGLIFGIYPAWRAAGLRPIEALRYE